MSSGPHPDIVGYLDCKRCGQPELKYLMSQTAGLCWDCVLANPVVQRAKELEISHRGVVTSILRDAGKKARKQRNRHSANVHIRQLTTRRALHRLRDRHAEEYFLLLQEERIAAGWPPQVARDLNIIGRAIETMGERLRYLRFISPEELDADSSHT